MKKITAIAIFFTLIIFFIVNACKKDNCTIPCNVCEEIPIENPRRSIKNKADQEKSPCFNPNDGNEFVYIKRQGKKNSLMKYNIVEQKISIVLADMPTIASQPQWGKNGWIVFTTLDYELNIVKPDGSDYKKITDGIGSFFEPIWKNDSIVAAELTYTGGRPYYYSEVDINGTLRDTISKIGFDIGSFNSKKESAYLIYDHYPNISVRSGKVITELVHAAVLGKPGGKYIADIIWHPNDDDIFYTRFFYGISKINRNTMVDARFIVGCETRQYKDISISPDGKKIIVERVDASDYKGTDTITEDAGIYIMDIDGKNERKIEL